MQDFKAKEVRKPVIEHLLTIGYTTHVNIDILEDSPYLIADADILSPVLSVQRYKASTSSELNEIDLLQLQPALVVKYNDKLYQIATALVKYLNSDKVKGSDNYFQIFTVQPARYEMLSNKWEVLPVSPNACGSISADKISIITTWLSHNLPDWHSYSFSYTDYNENKSRYGTYRPCINLY